MLIFRILLLIQPLWAARYHHGTLDERVYWYMVEDESTNAQLFEGLGCYCKQVESESECPEYKQPPNTATIDYTNPGYYRYFHADPSGDRNQCCKLAKTSIFDVKGWKYKRQETMDFCTYEIRSVPDDACCRILPPPIIDLDWRKAYKPDWHYIPRSKYHYGLHVRAVTMLAGVKIVYYGGEMVKEFIKSKPQVSDRDILDGKDYNGSLVSAAKVKDFVRMHPDLRLACTEKWRYLIEDKKECKLRPEPIIDCCCDEATLDEGEECLPAPGVPDGRIVLNGTYTESIESFPEGDFKKGEISWDESPLQAIKSYVKAPDPKNEALTFDWQAKYDWTCLSNKEYPVIGERMESSFLQEGENPYELALRKQQRARQAWQQKEAAKRRKLQEQHARKRRIAVHRMGRSLLQSGPNPRIVRKAQERKKKQRRARAERNRQKRQRQREEEWRQANERLRARKKVHYQDQREECFSREYQRACPAGQWLYQKVIPFGKCMKEPTATEPLEGILVEKGEGSLDFQCPDHHKGRRSSNSDENCLCKHEACQQYSY